ncbi:MAG: hypothetical protein OXF88_05690 [Rhodobacteraceae bacterium]|nr:hypothetical protein [Paracoccaceae bacterium]MCY4136922.1 hypothetical protein [Paracoccaceae bacterium]
MKQLLATTFLLLVLHAAAAEPVAGIRSVAITVEHHGSMMSGVLWYPAGGGGEAITYGENGVFFGTPVLDNARMAEGPFPVILASHGLGGNVGTLSWLTAGLAEAGALVISVNHPNSTTRDFNLHEGLKHWTRTQDLRAALDWIAAQPELAAQADFSRVYAVGFSAGGWTALALGGLRADLQGYAAHCETASPSLWHCADLTWRGADLAAYSPGEWNASRKDDRIRAVAAIDPALTYGLGRTHARDLVKKVLLIGLGGVESRLPATDFSATGSGFAGQLPAAEIEIMAPAAHFSALLPCKPRGPAILAAEGDYPLCDDPPGTDRAALHKRIVSRVAVFLGL